MTLLSVRLIKRWRHYYLLKPHLKLACRTKWRNFPSLSNQLDGNKFEHKIWHEKQKEKASGFVWDPLFSPANKSILKFLEGIILPAIFLENTAIKPEIQKKEGKQTVANN